MSKCVWMYLGFWIWLGSYIRQISEYGKVLNMKGSQYVIVTQLHSVLNMSKYALIEFWMYHRS